MTETITLTAEFLAEFEIGSEIEELVFPQSQTLQIIQGSTGNTIGQREISLTNIPSFTHDHIINASFGLKFNPKKEMMIIANVIIPLNEGGLRSSFIPTIGFEFCF